jgi:hypothetical protein
LLKTWNSNQVKKDKNLETPPHKETNSEAPTHYLDIIGLEIDENKVANQETKAMSPSKSHHTQHCVHNSHDVDDDELCILYFGTF